MFVTVSGQWKTKKGGLRSPPVSKNDIISIESHEVLEALKDENE
jgi:hypothetical protein